MWPNLFCFFHNICIITQTTLKQIEWQIVWLRVLKSGGAGSATQTQKSKIETIGGALSEQCTVLYTMLGTRHKLLRQSDTVLNVY